MLWDGKEVGGKGKRGMVKCEARMRIERIGMDESGGEEGKETSKGEGKKIR